MINKIKNVFFECEVDITKNKIIILNGVFCVKFYIYENIIIIDDIAKCNISGTETLKRIEVFSREVGIEAISLSDKSVIEWNNFRISLSTLNILSKGESWYNSLGYLQTNYIKEKEDWQILCDLTMQSLFDLIKTITEKDIINFPNFEKGFNFAAFNIYGSTKKTLTTDKILYFNKILLMGVEYIILHLSHMLNGISFEQIKIKDFFRLIKTIMRENTINDQGIINSIYILISFSSPLIAYDCKLIKKL